MERQCVYCEAGAGFLNICCMIFILIVHCEVIILITCEGDFQLMQVAK